MREFQFDGLVGPTHNYGGLSPGNTASTTHEGRTSNPRAAALQGLAKMRLVRGLGVPQAVLPPQARPSIEMLRRMGFRGSDEAVIAGAAAGDGFLLRLCSSASAMWTANAATIAPSSDTLDRHVHLTAANLTQMFHRSIEASVTARVLRAIFADEAASSFTLLFPGPASSRTRAPRTIFAWRRPPARRTSSRGAVASGRTSQAPPSTTTPAGGPSVTLPGRRSRRVRPFRASIVSTPHAVSSRVSTRTASTPAPFIPT